MEEIGAYEAKTHLPRLLERVQHGERFIITRHGRPVAELVPVTVRSHDEIRAAIDALASFRMLHPLRGASMRELIDEGRKR